MTILYVNFVRNSVYFFYFYILYVLFKRVDEDSGLHKDLQELTNHPKLEDHLGLQFLFKVSCY